MVFRISFGLHRSARYVERLRAHLSGSVHHILESTVRSKFVSKTLETYSSFERHRDTLRRQYSQSIDAWKPMVALAEQGGLHNEPMDISFRNNALAGRLILISEENARRKASGLSTIKIHFEPLTEESLTGVLRTGTLESNLQFALKSGNYEKFIGFARNQLKEKRKHYETRNQNFLEMAERLHLTD